MIEVTAAIVTEAHERAAAHALRGDDAIHLASSLLVRGSGTAGVSGDRQLRKAWETLGFAYLS